MSSCLKFTFGFCYFNTPKKYDLAVATSLNLSLKLPLFYTIVYSITTAGFESITIGFYSIAIGFISYSTTAILNSSIKHAN